MKKQYDSDFPDFKSEIERYKKAKAQYSDLLPQKKTDKTFKVETQDYSIKAKQNSGEYPYLNFELKGEINDTLNELRKEIDNYQIMIHDKVY